MTNTMSTPSTTSTDGRGSITCTICQAVYAPTPDHAYLLRASRVALESAFMSMCHFCFRCRRAACPNCWDNIHGVCATCALEAQLPFRVQTQPLEGALFPPTRQAQLARKQSIPNRLICIRPGRFQQAAPLDNAETLAQLSTQTPAQNSPLLSPQSITPHPLSPILPESPTLDEIPTHKGPPIHPITQPLTHHTALPQPSMPPQQTLGQPPTPRRRETLDLQQRDQEPPTVIIKKDAQPVLPSWEYPTVIRTSTPRASASKAASPTDIERLKTRPTANRSRAKNDIENIKTRPNPRRKKTTNNNIQTSPSTRRPHTITGVADIKTRSTRQHETRKSLENLLTFLSALLLLCVLTLIISALVSASANTFIENILQIDIRAEVAYLWQFITHLFSL